MAMSIGEYEILGRDACGGAGLPYRVRHLRTGEFATLKVLPESGSAADQLRVVGNRVEALRRVKHPNVMPVTDFGQDVGGAVFLVSPSVACQPLSEMLADRAPLPEEETREISLDIAGALAAAHDAGVTHGALQPRSVLLTQDGSVLVTDFVLRDVIPAHATGSFLPTVDYIAPECADSGECSPASDAFALGVMMRECLAGSARAATTNGAAEQTSFLSRVAAGLQTPDPTERLTVRRALVMMSPEVAATGPLPATPVPIRSNTQRDIRLLYASDGEGYGRRSRTAPLVAFGIVALVAAGALAFAAARLFGDGGTNLRPPSAVATAEPSLELPTAVRRDEAVAPVFVTPGSASRTATSAPQATIVARPTAAVRAPNIAVPPTPIPANNQAPPPAVAQPRPTTTSRETEELLAETIVLRALGNARFYRTRDVADISDTVTGSALRTYEGEAWRLRSIDAYIDSNQTELLFESIEYSGAYAQVTTAETWEHVDRRASTGEVLGSRRARARVTYGLVFVGERWLVESSEHSILSNTPL